MNVIGFGLTRSFRLQLDLTKGLANALLNSP